MKLDAYLKRISFTGEVRPDLATLNALMDAHIRAVPFENLDIHGQRPVIFSTEAAYEEIVARGQGGWCYEMNAVFGWALSEIGFEVTRLAAGVRREKLGDAALGNHLSLMVRLDRDYLVDVGFGSSQSCALLLEAALTNHPPIQIALAKADGDMWRLHEGGERSSVSYDFSPEPGDEARLAVCHDEQITDPNSIFRKTLIAKIRRDNAWISLRGRMMETFTPGKNTPLLIDSPEELASVLKDVFGLTEPALPDLWPAICARHKQLFRHTWR